jgi:hypothetical protein
MRNQLYGNMKAIEYEVFIFPKVNYQPVTWWYILGRSKLFDTRANCR